MITAIIITRTRTRTTTFTTIRCRRARAGRRVGGRYTTTHHYQHKTTKHYLHDFFDGIIFNAKRRKQIVLWTSFSSSSHTERRRQRTTSNKNKNKNKMMKKMEKEKKRKKTTTNQRTTRPIIEFRIKQQCIAGCIAIIETIIK